MHLAMERWRRHIRLPTRGRCTQQPRGLCGSRSCSICCALSSPPSPVITAVINVLRLDARDRSAFAATEPNIDDCPRHVRILDETRLAFIEWRDPRMPTQPRASYYQVRPRWSEERTVEPRHCEQQGLCGSSRCLLPKTSLSTAIGRCAAVRSSLSRGSSRRCRR